MIKDCCYLKCAAALIIIMSLLALGDFSFAGNPLVDILTGKKTERPRPITPIKIPRPDSGRPTKTPRSASAADANDFVYMLAHPERKKVHGYWKNSDKSMTFVEYLKGYDARHVKIIRVQQQLQFNGQSYRCRCGCVPPGKYNSYKPPSTYKIKTLFNLKAGPSDSRCKCGCKLI